jgi:ribosome recycling factor
MADTDQERKILSATEERMSVAVDAFRQRLAGVRTGRASLAIFEGVAVDYYGTRTPINQVAKLSVPEPTLILVQPFDQSTLQSIEKAILTADLGLNPSNDGKLIRVPIPPLTEERRKQLVKKVHGLLEEAKTIVRQVRRESNDEIRSLEKDGDISEDDSRRDQEEIQKATDKHVRELDQLSASKEKELLEV